MAVHGLFPAFMLVRYHSIYGAHTQILPTREWNPLAGTNGYGGYEAWDSSERDAEDMVTDFLAATTLLQSDEIDYDDVIIYTLATPTSPAIPRKVIPLVAVTGQDGTPGYFKGVQFTFTFFDTEFNKSKLVLLDASSNNDFTKRTSLAAMSADEGGVVTEWTLDTNAWASRAGFRPSSALSLTKTINDKLRKSYRDS